MLRELDEIGLAAVEQPLARSAWQDHARLAEMLVTPVVLDESIGSLADLDLALTFGSADGVSIKAARLGGILAALPVIERARSAGLSLCIGGMYETGIGRSTALALGALSGFDLPGDLGASDRYFACDITKAHHLVNGCLEVPRTVGIGRVPSPGALARFAVRRRTFLPS
jgi:O-succinylbenzoate synthase